MLFDPARVSYEQLLQVFFTVAHDPTQLNRQGPDRGTQYRSAVFYESEAQRRAAGAYVARAAGALRRPIVTQISPLDRFWPAEEYHQDFYKKNPFRYKSYSTGCGRYARLDELWGPLRKSH